MALSARYATSLMRALKLLVIAPPNARHLAVLERLPDDTTITVGNSAEAFARAASEAEVILNTSGNHTVLRQIWPAANKVRWVHSLSAGVEGVLFPELIESPVPLTNARGVYKESLGEFVLAAILYFAKDLGRMRRSQASRRWDQFDVDMICRQTLGIVGYGEIGRAIARRAKAMGMTVCAVRRRSQVSGDDPLVDRAFTVPELRALMSESDYVAVAAPHTVETRGLIGPVEIASMKPSGVIINVGRGPVVDEPALIHALSGNRIRGAALDVFNQEPLPSDHPFWGLDNVLLSPHCADHTATWLEEAMMFFVENFRRFKRGEPLQNVVDKQAGY
jgi:phosphoglycerate dehydrogenase-like enzyme